MRRPAVPALTILGLITFCPVIAAGQNTPGDGYRIQSSEVVVPPDVGLGQYQRIIRPFGNWALICDENLGSKQRICNVTQTIQDNNGVMAFNWSLAATKDGKPYILLRTPADANFQKGIALKFPDRKAPLNIAFKGCNDVVCVGIVPVGPIMRSQIKAESKPKISYTKKDGTEIRLNGNLTGLETALQAID